MKKKPRPADRLPLLTRDIAWAAARDAGNARMRAGSRRAWSRGDYNAAVAEFNRLWPAERQIVDCRP
jgi:hypothetical protein